MQQLKALIKKYKMIGCKKSHSKGGNYNDYVEYQRIGELILKEVIKLYDNGKLKDR